MITVLFILAFTPEIILIDAGSDRGIFPAIEFTHNAEIVTSANKNLDPSSYIFLEKTIKIDEADQSLSALDHKPKIMVKRNDIATMTYSNGNFLATIKVRALSKGSVGDIIPVMNMSSKKILKAEILRGGALSYQLISGSMQP